MNKVIFSQGGQPIYLDDVALIQNNCFDVFRSLILSLTGVDSPCLLNPYEFDTEIIDEAQALVRLTIKANAIVYNGEIVYFPETSFTNKEINEVDEVVKVCVKSTESDLRVFNDGQQRFCRKSVFAYLSLSGAGADASYDITSLSSLPELLVRRIGYDSSTVIWREIPVVFYNGYSGSIKYADGRTLQIKMDVKTSAKQWNTPGPGVICKIADSSLVEKLKGKASNPISIIPLRPDGTVLGYGSGIKINDDGTFIIINRTSQGGLANGYIPPTHVDDEYSTIAITF